MAILNLGLSFFLSFHIFSIQFITKSIEVKDTFTCYLLTCAIDLIYPDRQGDEQDQCRQSRCNRSRSYRYKKNRRPE